MFFQMARDRLVVLSKRRWGFVLDVCIDSVTCLLRSFGIVKASAMEHTLLLAVMRETFRLVE